LTAPRVLPALAALVLLACARGPVRAHLAEPFPEKLSEWRLFEGRLNSLRPNARVVPYDVAVPLFSDHASKFRTLWMPEGTAAEYRDSGAFEFPEGTIFSKTFFYEQDGRRELVETRLLVRASAGWTALPYVWDKAQTEATLQLAGDEQARTWAAPDGSRQDFTYLVPNADQCAGCHVTLVGRERPLRPLGPTARQLDVAVADGAGGRSQIDAWSDRGMLRGAPQRERRPRWESAALPPLAARARAYLDVQCAHCHSPQGPANASGLFLGFDETRPERLGQCKTPVAAGRGSGDRAHDIEPGRPDDSILYYRMESREPDVMMPELGRSLRDDDGLRLVRDWIAGLPGGCS
jgi:uncharacterized repeat protein (TIGR03806 family)